jgi:protein LTV1
MPELLASPSASAKPPSKPQPQAKPKSKSKSAFPARRVRFGSIEAEDLVDADGLPRDGYDYTQHMKEMGQGRFYSATGRFDVASGALARKVALPEDVLPSGEEQARLLDAITLTTEAMDGDLREALENDAAFEALDDDFMAQAALEATDGDAAADDGFDYDAHIAKLMAAASGVPKVRGDLTDDEDEDDEELSDLEDEEEDDELDDEARAEEQRALDALFEKTLAEEYDDEQLGELEEDDPETRGELALEGALLDEIVADFAQVQQEVLDAEGKLGNPLAPAGNRLQQIREECAREEEEEADVEGEEAVTPAGEDVETQLRRMMERSAYLAPRAQEQWDCETIVSTYSTLDNHPTVLRETDPLKKKKKKKAPTVDAGAADGARLGRIELSRKTGMPLGVFERRRQPEEDEESEEEEDEDREDRGKARGRGESKEQKRARKAAAKLLKTQRRADKKETKLAFKDELQRQQAQTAPGRVAIFRY